MTYIVLETQTNGDTTAIVPPVSYANRNAAESAFHATASTAAVSSIEEHTVMLLTSDGRLALPSVVYRNPALPEETELIQPN